MRRQKESEPSTPPQVLTRVTENISVSERARQRRKVIEAEQKAALLTEGLPVVEADVDATLGPIEVNFRSDYHWGAGAMDMKLADKDTELISENECAVVFFLGDEIEGSKKDYRSIERRRGGSVTDDIVLFKEFVLKQLKDKAITSVGYYDSHNGWSWIESDVDVWDEIFAKEGIPVGMNGHLTILTVKDEGEIQRVVKYKLAHYFGKSSTKDTFHHVRNAYLQDDADSAADGYGQGHTHQSGAAKEWPMGAPKPVILIQSGTFKGINPRVGKDGFGQQVGLSGILGGPGQATIITEKNIHFAATRDRTTKMHSALKFLDTQPRLAEEALEIAKNEPPEATFREKNSQDAGHREEVKPEKKKKKQDVEKKVDAEQREEQATSQEEEQAVESSAVYAKKYEPIFKKMVYNLQTKHPTLLFPVGNVRKGSSYEGFSKLTALTGVQLDGPENNGRRSSGINSVLDVPLSELKFFKNNPHIYYLLLGNMMDDETAGKSEKEAELSAVAEWINLVGANQFLALLQDSRLRNAKWAPIAPGTYISRQTGVKLMSGGGILQIHHGKNAVPQNNAKHEIELLDGLFGFGSYTKPMKGLVNYYKNTRGKRRDVLMTAHHPHSGAATILENGGAIDMLNVGFFAEFDGGSGKRNVMAPSPAGQALIIDGKERYPTATLSDTIELYQALLAFSVANQHGMLR